MKIVFIITGVALCLVATTVCSQRAKLGPVSSEHRVNNVKGQRRVYTDRECKFRLDIALGGRYDQGVHMYVFGPTKSHPAGSAFSFACHAGATQNEIYDQLQSKPVDGKWIWKPSGKPYEPKQKFQLIKLSGKNWHGTGIAFDQIYYAPPERRSRFFNFCLVQDHGPQVLCGNTQIRGVTQPDSMSRLPNILAVLKTIVFVKPPGHTARSSVDDARDKP